MRYRFRIAGGVRSEAVSTDLYCLCLYWSARIAVFLLVIWLGTAGGHKNQQNLVRVRSRERVRALLPFEI